MMLFSLSASTLWLAILRLIGSAMQQRNVTHQPAGFSTTSLQNQGALEAD